MEAAWKGILHVGSGFNEDMEQEEEEEDDDNDDKDDEDEDVKERVKGKF
jgi:hypothetical protein